MMSELVAVSAWTWPPEVAAGADAFALAVTGALGVALLWGLVAALPIAARSVAASLVASAFLRYTTWILPKAPLLERPGWSSLATKDLTNSTRAVLAARTTKVLLRGSAMTVVLKLVSAVPGAAPDAVAVESISLRTKGARSTAMACLSSKTSTCVALDTSMAAMMRAIRRRLSA